MSNYIKTTNFAAKDSLPSGNPAKIVKGTEINTEFDNIAVASATKLNSSAVSTFGGTLIDDANASAARTTLGLGTAATTASTDYATAAQGATADAALPKTGGAMTGAITTNSTFDGRDVATDGTKLDGIEAGADVTDTTNVVASLSAGTGISLSAGGEIANTAPDQTVALTGAGGTSISGTYPSFTITSTSFALPVATDTTLGGIELFSDTDQTVVANAVTTTAARTYGIQLNSDDQAVVNVPWTDTTYTVGDGGLTEINFTSADNTKLDGIEASADVTDTANVTAAGALMTTGGTLTGDLNFGDNDKATFGAGSDLEIYHDGTNNYIDDAGVGDLILRGNNQVLIRDKATDDVMVNCRSNEFVKLYYDNSEKLATTSTGIDVTGTATMDGLVSSGDSTIGGSSATSNVLLDLVEPTSSSDIILGVSANGSGRTQIRSTQGLGTSSDFRLLTVDSGSTRERLKIANNGDISFYEDTGTTPKFHWSSSTERLGLGTTSPQGQIAVSNAATTDVMELDTSPGFSRFMSLDRTTGDEKYLQIRAKSIGFALDSGTDNVTIDSSGRVGIGTSSPDTQLHVSKSSVSGTSYDSNDLLTLENNGFTAINMISSASTASTLIFSDTTRAVGYLQYNHSDNSLRTNVNGSERMRIDSSGNLLVGKTSADVDTAGTCLRGSTSSIFTVDGNVDTQVAIFNRKSNDGTIADFRKDGTTVGSIGTGAGEIIVGRETTGLKFQHVTRQLIPRTTANASADAEIDLGSTSSRFKDLHLSGAANVGSIAVTGAITEDAETLTGTATTIDLATATNFTHTLTGATTYTFSNPATTGNATAFTLKVIQDTTARTITWPASVDWAGGTAPTLTATSGGVDVFVFYTIDGGTTYYGFTAGQAMA